MDEKFNPKICDFGLASKLEGKNGTGKLSEIVGTKGYLPPEMLIKTNYDGAKADIFCLGIILLIITAGGIGFTSARKNEYYYKYIYKNKFDDYWKVTGYKLDEDLKRLIFEMFSFNPDKRPSIKQILGSSWLKEIIDIKDKKEFEILENEVCEEFKQIEKKILEKNKTLVIQKEDANDFGENRGSSQINKYFDLDLTPKYALEKELNMRHYLKIVGDENPCKLMNRIANKINMKYGNKIVIYPSSHKLKFDISFENMDEENAKEKNEEENKEEDKEEEEDEEEEDESIEKKIKREKDIIQVKLFESLKGGYIIRFTKKEGGTIKYHKYLNELRNIIEKL